MKLFKNYGLSITLFALFFFSWLGQYYFQWIEFIEEQSSHNQVAEISSFIPIFLSRTLENWQSEFLQLFTFVVLTTYLIHKGSHESKDSDDEMKRMLQDIQKRLPKRG